MSKKIQISRLEKEIHVPEYVEKFEMKNQLKKALDAKHKRHGRLMLDKNSQDIQKIEISGKNHPQMASLNALPWNVDVFKRDEGDLGVTMSNQGMTLGEWIHHFCSISNKVKLCEAEIRVGYTEFDIQSLRNTFPKLRNIGMHGSRNETSEHDTLKAQYVSTIC
ncbi:hypothetical protein B9Z55_027597 [Caenorhabditis nigoni]|uniref:Uncharacterized protein n=1 Tax=Caenorhabditis nigoni TaxID=1611254 RepID=A0A2G5SFC4_9PELO|nr:hypothetical protein B9Z55_027597 [Caenorhabditis nigoni]